jgi:NADH-quinone oxidoreductase subunit F
MMKYAGWKSIIRSWIGLAAVCIALVAAVWLLSVHIRARFHDPTDKAYVEELKQKASTDTEIQKILQPELDRQHQTAVRRRAIYNGTGLLLLIMAGIFLVWYKWLRPGPGEWRGVPARLLKYLDRNAAATPPIEVPAPSEEYCQFGQRACKRYARKGPCDLPECPLAVAERKKAGKGAVAIPYMFQPLDESIYGRLSAIAAGRAPAGSNPAGSNGNGMHGLPADAAVESAPVEIRIGLASCGIAAGSQQVRLALEEAVASLGGGAAVKAVGCNGSCHSEPLVEVVENGHRACYGKVKPAEVRKIVRRHLKPRGLARKVGEQVRDLRARLFEDDAWAPLPQPDLAAAPDMKKQVRLVLENCGEIDPLALEEYRRRKGFLAFEKCLQHLSPEEVIARVRACGLRDRNGAGLPTASSWAKARNADPCLERIICAANGFDPGSFIDRMLLESDPFRIIEGMAIAAYAAGAREGFLLIRPEHALALRTIRAAIDIAEKQGFLGESIRGSAFSFSLRAEQDDVDRRLSLAAGDIETLACLPWILREGIGAFAALGTEKSKGTRLFSLTGKISRGGLIEVPMGITLREIVEEIGGGIKDGRKFKAAMIGGLEGGCLPEALAGTRMEYEELAAQGVSMGSGGLLVLDDRSCVVDITRYFLHLSLRLTQSEAGFGCPLCQEGVRQLLGVVERICDGKGKAEDLKVIEDISDRIRRSCGCRLGQLAPNPVLTTLRHFREEYETHIRRRRCPAAACKSLIHYRILDNCTGCTLCAQVCPVNAIQAQPYQIHKITDDLCTRCDMCLPACPENAIRVE